MPVDSRLAPKAPWGIHFPTVFFCRFLAQAMQSLFGRPRHRGNRNFENYRMLGLDFPERPGRSAFRKASQWP